MAPSIGYVRVSSTDQNTERQLAGMALEKTFEDKASGKDTNRPQLQACIEYLREGDTLQVHSIDRLARNMEDLQRIVRTLTGKGVSVQFVKKNLLFQAGKSNPMQELLFHVLASFAQFERAMIKERQREGIAAAKKEGRQLGRKKALPLDQEQAIRAEAATGVNKKDLAVRFGISRPTLYRILGNS